MTDGEKIVQHTHADAHTHLAMECNARKLLGVTAFQWGGHGRPEVDERRLQLLELIAELQPFGHRFLRKQLLAREAEVGVEAVGHAEGVEDVVALRLPSACSPHRLS